MLSNGNVFNRKHISELINFYTKTQKENAAAYVVMISPLPSLLFLE